MEPLEHLIKIKTTPEILVSLLNRAIAELTDSSLSVESMQADEERVECS